MTAVKHPDESSELLLQHVSPPLCQVHKRLPVHGSPPVMTILRPLSSVCIRIAASAAAAVTAAFLQAILRGVADAVYTPDSDLLLASVAALLCADGCVQAAAMLCVSAVQQLAPYCVPWLEAYAQQQTAQYVSGTAAAVCCEARRLLTRISYSRGILQRKRQMPCCTHACLSICVWCWHQAAADYVPNGRCWHMPMLEQAPAQLDAN